MQERVSAAFSFIPDVGRKHSATYHPLDYDPNQLCYMGYPRNTDFARDPWATGHLGSIPMAPVVKLIRAWFLDTQGPTIRSDFRIAPDEATNRRYLRNYGAWMAENLLPNGTSFRTHIDWTVPMRRVLDHIGTTPKQPPGPLYTMSHDLTVALLNGVRFHEYYVRHRADDNTGLKRIAKEASH